MAAVVTARAPSRRLARTAKFAEIASRNFHCSDALRALAVARPLRAALPPAEGGVINFTFDPRLRATGLLRSVRRPPAG